MNFDHKENQRKYNLKRQRIHRCSKCNKKSYCKKGGLCSECNKLLKWGKLSKGWRRKKKL